MTHKGYLIARHSPWVLIAWLLLESCGGSSKVAPTPKCYLSSDCQNPLQCVQTYCVAACVQSRDCPSGERCITATQGNTCQPLETATCQYTSQCTAPLVCALDRQCRNQCQKDVDCTTGQKCTSVTHLCADPFIDKNYDPATNEFVGMDDGGVAGDGGTSMGDLDAGADGPPNGDGAADKPVDAPSLVPDGGLLAVDGGGGPEVGGNLSGDSGTAGASGTNCTPGQAPTNFGQPATSDSNPNYTSGVGVLTATEFLTFNAYAGPATTDGGVVAGGAAAAVARLDVQHFDPGTGKSKGSATPLLTTAGDGSGLYIDGAAVAPTGEIAIIYSAQTGTKWGVYVAFLDKSLVLKQSTQLVALGLDKYSDQSHVQWLNGEFVASAVVNNNSSATIKMAKFGANGGNVGGTSTIPTDDSSGYVSSYNNDESEIAFSGGGLFAVAYLNTVGLLPYLTILDTLGTEVGDPVKLPSALSFSGYSSGSFVSVAGTSKGFVAVYNGTSASNAASLLGTFVSNVVPVDAGTVPVGSTVAFPGGYGYGGNWCARGSSDGVGAGFAVLYPDGSVNFIYFNGNGALATSPQSILEQANTASVGDEVQMTNFGGNFAASLYSSAEHLTRVVVSSCQ